MQFLCLLPPVWRAHSLRLLTILMAWPLTRRVTFSSRKPFGMQAVISWSLPLEARGSFSPPGSPARNISPLGLHDNGVTDEANETEISHDRVSWQSRWIYSLLGPTYSRTHSVLA